MSSRRLARPLFPVPPIDYNQQYMAEIVRQFSVFIQQIQNPGDARFTELTLTGLQENDVGLPAGGVYKQGGFLKIAELYIAAPAGTSASASPGTVTVSIS